MTNSDESYLCLFELYFLYMAGNGTQNVSPLGIEVVSGPTIIIYNDTEDQQVSVNSLAGVIMENGLTLD